MLHPDYHCVDASLSPGARLDIAYWLQAILETCQQAAYYPHVRPIVIMHAGAWCHMTTCN